MCLVFVTCSFLFIYFDLILSGLQLEGLNFPLGLVSTCVCVCVFTLLYFNTPQYCFWRSTRYWADSLSWGIHRETRDQSQVNTLITVFLHEMSSRKLDLLWRPPFICANTQFTSYHFFILDGRNQDTAMSNLLVEPWLVNDSQSLLSSGRCPLPCWLCPVTMDTCQSRLAVWPDRQLHSSTKMYSEIVG